MPTLLVMSTVISSQYCVQMAYSAVTTGFLEQGAQRYCCDAKGVMCDNVLSLR